MGKILGLGHVALVTSDTQRSIDFYKLLGFSVAVSDTIESTPSTKLTLICAGSCIIELIEKVGQNVSGRPEGQFPHLCLEVDDISSVVEELKRKGVDTFLNDSINVSTLLGGIKNINLKGPDGEIIELLENIK